MKRNQLFKKDCMKNFFYILLALSSGAMAESTSDQNTTSAVEGAKTDSSGQSPVATEKKNSKDDKPATEEEVHVNGRSSCPLTK
jgi:hypothetical protein